MVDELRVRRLLRQATDTVELLYEEAGADDAVRAQRRWLDSIKYNFIAAIECCVDVGQHICAVNGWGPPASNADTFKILPAHGVLEGETSMSSWTSTFRKPLARAISRAVPRRSRGGKSRPHRRHSALRGADRSLACPPLSADSHRGGRRSGKRAERRIDGSCGKAATDGSHPSTLDRPRSRRQR